MPALVVGMANEGYQIPYLAERRVPRPNHTRVHGHVDLVCDVEHRLPETGAAIARGDPELALEEAVGKLAETIGATVRAPPGG